MDVTPDEAGAPVSVAGAVALTAVAMLVVPPAAAPRLRALVRAGAKADRSATARIRRLVRRRGGSSARSPESSSSDSALALDLLSACLSAGIPVPTAVSAVADATTGPAAEALKATAHALSLGASPDMAWQRAREHPSTADLARAACRTASSGSALAAHASTLAERLRSTEADRIEARAQRTSVLVAGPLGLCFLPAFFCLGVIPVVLGLASRLHVLP